MHIFLVSSYLSAWCHWVLICTVRKTRLCCILSHFPRQKYPSLWERGLKFLERNRKLDIWNAAKGTLKRYLSLSPSATYSNGRLLLDSLSPSLGFSWVLHYSFNPPPPRSSLILSWFWGKDYFINLHVYLTSCFMQGCEAEVRWLQLRMRPSWDFWKCQNGQILGQGFCGSPLTLSHLVPLYIFPPYIFFSLRVYIYKYICVCVYAYMYRKTCIYISLCISSQTLGSSLQEDLGPRNQEDTTARGKSWRSLSYICHIPAE